MRESGNIDRWRNIRDAAIRLFDMHGYASVSIDQIAEEAGVSRRTFFNYFPTKAASLFDPDPDETRILEGLLEDAAGEASVWDTTRRALSEYFRAQSSVIGVRRRIIRDDPALDALLMAAYVEFDQPVRQWLVERVGDGLAANAACGIAMSLMREAYMAWSPEDGIDALLSLMDEAFDIAAKGLGEL